MMQTHRLHIRTVAIHIRSIRTVRDRAAFEMKINCENSICPTLLERFFFVVSGGCGPAQRKYRTLGNENMFVWFCFLGSLDVSENCVHSSQAVWICGTNFTGRLGKMIYDGSGVWQGIEDCWFGYGFAELRNLFQVGSLGFGKEGGLFLNRKMNIVKCICKLEWSIYSFTTIR